MAKAIRICSVAGCGKRHYGLGLCSGHYQRSRRCGTLVAEGTTRGEPREFLHRAMGHEGTGDCLLWPFSVGSHGYGQMSVNGAPMTVHHLVCQEVHGNRPSREHEVAHSCGERLCVNPHHLRWATASSNQADKLIHRTDNRSVKQWTRKLDPELARELVIAKRRMTIAKVAARFGVSTSTVTRVLAGQQWADATAGLRQ